MTSGPAACRGLPVVLAFISAQAGHKAAEPVATGAAA